MAHYLDLSQYQYDEVTEGDPSKTLCVGWLERGQKFEIAAPGNWLLERLWAHCRFAVDDARGYHSCDLPKCTWRKLCRGSASEAPYIPSPHLNLCEKEGRSPHPDYPTVADYRRARAKTRIIYERTLITAARHHHKEELGYSEIRIFGPNDIVYAAPNLVFHYVRDHHYKMPDEVIEALRTGPCPPEKEWFDRLRLTGARLDMRQCWSRAFRNLKRHEWSLGMFEIPIGPVKWIPETLHPNWLHGKAPHPVSDAPPAPKNRTTEPQHQPKGRASHSLRAAPAHRTTEPPKH